MRGEAVLVAAVDVLAGWQDSYDGGAIASCAA